MPYARNTMDLEDDQLDELPQRASPRTKSKVTGRRAAQQLIRRLAWSEWPLVFRAPGELTTNSKEPMAVPEMHETFAALRRRLSKLATGAYAIELTPGGSTAEDAAKADDGDAPAVTPPPKVLQVTPVNDALIASALRQLLETRRFPHWMPRLVGDVAAWTGKVERQIAMARLVGRMTAVDSSREEDSRTSLRIEAACLWTGNDEARPSRAINPTLLLKQVLNATGELSPVDEAAAVLLGQRGVSRPLPRGLEPWRACGGVLREWPLDVVVHAARSLGSPMLLADAVAPAGMTSEPALVPVVRELLLSRAAATDLVAAIRMMSVLSAGLDRLRQEIDRRFGRLAAAQQTAVECGHIASNWQPDAPPSAARHKQETIFLGAYEASVQTVTAVEALRHFDTPIPAPPRRKRERRFPAIMMTAESLCREILGDETALAGAGRRVLPPAAPAETHNSRLSERAAAWVFAAAESWRAAIDALRTPRLVALAIALQRAGLATSCEQWARAWTAWADAACTCVRPGRSGDNHWLILAQFPDIATTAKAMADPAAYWRAVEAAAADILTCAALPHHFVGPPMWVTYIAPEVKDVSKAFAKVIAASPDPQVVRDALGGNWTKALHQMTDASPDRVRLALDWFSMVSETREVPRHGAVRWIPLDSWMPPRLGRLFATAELGLLRRLTNRLTPPLFAPKHAASTLFHVVTFLDPPYLYADPSDARITKSERSDYLRRQRLLRLMPFLLEELLGRDGEPPPPADPAPLWWLERCQAVAAWQEGGHPNPRALWDAMARRAVERRAKGKVTARAAERPFAFNSEPQVIAALWSLARNDIHRAMTLAYLKSPLSWHEWDAVAKSWNWLSRDERFGRVLSPLVDQPALLARLLRWMVRVGVCLRLPDATAMAVEMTRLAAAVAPAAEPDVAALPALNYLPADLAARVRSITSLNGGECPKRVRDVVERESRLHEELKTLNALPELSGPATRRRDNLEQYLQHPQQLTDWIVADLRKLLPSLQDELLLSALERAAEQTIARHFARLLGTIAFSREMLTGHGGRDWDNAIRLYFTVEKNRALLLRLMRRRAAGERGWIERHPPNRRFLDAITARGIDIAAWRGPYRETFATGAGPLTVELEDDPLHVLQMGNYFDTCLAEGGINSFSTVANAWEANKRVAYVRDVHGHVVGRKLLVLTAAGRIAGFRSYGTGNLQTWEQADDPSKASPWMKIVLDAFCRTLADRCGATLHPYPDVIADDPVNDEKPLTLFAAWYHDGCEAFDRWWVQHSAAKLRADITAGGLLAKCLVGDLRLASADRSQLTHPQQWALPEAIRLLLWLGDEAIAVLERMKGEGVPQAVLDHLDRHGVGSELRKWLSEPRP